MPDLKDLTLSVATFPQSAEIGVVIGSIVGTSPVLVPVASNTLFLNGAPLMLGDAPLTLGSADA